MSDLTGAVWRKSSRSNSQGQCVEVADNLADVVAVRDTKDRAGGTLTFTPSAWKSFVGGVKAGSLA
ncbi:DUF397 domain-containing protein [Micromonospora sp. NPDC049559]|uniref:DUF397 domain-containing protein n=1 Tax=Micromonospora sp. NPDC049559 TaxID=3155923 RepID=UPI00341A7D45